ncbi:MAG: nicotinate-nucleotide--dimethylbenzimidazole phosphoribosyltransferase [Acidimicrobiales bacterium]
MDHTLGTFESSSSFAAALDSLRALDGAAAAEADAHQDRLTKPRGALGRLEELGSWLAGVAGCSPPPLPAPATVAVFAGDHGVLSEGVTPWPQEVTAQMVANFCAGGAAINVLAGAVGARVVVVDVGVATDLPGVATDLPGVATDPPGGRGAGRRPEMGATGPRLLHRRIRPGTANLVDEAAMTLEEAQRALDVGATVAADAVASGARCLVTGDMGIGNTTPSAALIAVRCGRLPAEITGRGTGIDDETLARKIGAVERAIGRASAAGELDTPLSTLASLGGLEIAALAGLVVGGAAARVPVVVDGVIALAALVMVEALAPAALPYVVAGHRSTEPAASAALAHLGLRPLLDLELRLGEGTGACLALPLLEAAARVLAEMATFDSAGVTEK